MFDHFTTLCLKGLKLHAKHYHRLLKHQEKFPSCQLVGYKQKFYRFHVLITIEQRVSHLVWTRLLLKPGTGPWKTWIQKNLDRKKVGSRKIWTLKNLDSEKNLEKNKTLKNIDPENMNMGLIMVSDFKEVCFTKTKRNVICCLKVC